MGRHRKTRREKNIRKDDYTGEWLVLKRFKQFQEPHIYGRFNTFREAKKYRDSLDKNDAWKDSLPDHKKYALKQSGRNYITLKNGSCYIYKTMNYIKYFYGRYASKHDAETVVYHLVRNNWEWEKIPEEIQQLRLPSNEQHKTYLPRNGDSDYVMVVRKLPGKCFNYGAYPSTKEAQKVIDWLNTNGWGKELPPELESLQVQQREPKYYSKTSIGNYHVYKTIRGKLYSFGTYSSEKEAQHAVTELKKHNWDKKWFEKNRENLNCNKRYNRRKKDA